MNVAEAIRYVRGEIDTVAGAEALSQAKELVGWAVDVEPAALMLHYGVLLSAEQLEALAEMTARRAAGEPLQYILGQWEFMGLPILVNAAVLIPRQDTECLAEHAERLIRARGYRSVLDLCCGSGCIGIALRKRTGVAVAGADISGDALAVARENAEMNGVDVPFFEGDLFAPVKNAFDLIVCNPPYLTKADMASLQPEVSYEPALALYGGADGLDFYRRIAREYDAFLNPGGALLLEIGASQEKTVLPLFRNATVFYDLAGNPRVVLAEKP